MTPDAVPTTPVAPKTNGGAAKASTLVLLRKVFSTTAIIAAAVVNDPAGSANSEISNGFRSAFSAASSMSSARKASLPPMNTPVRAASRGDRENIASCTSAGDLLHRDVGVGNRRVVTGVERHVDVERAHVRERRHHVQDVLGHVSSRVII